MSRAWVGVAFLMTACVAEEEPATPDPIVIGSTGIDTPRRAPCWHFEMLVNRSFRELVPYIGAVNGNGIVVDAPDGFEPYLGGTIVQEDGTVIILHAEEFHYEDGTVELGAFGRLPVDNPAWCEWFVATRIEE